MSKRKNKNKIDTLIKCLGGLIIIKLIIGFVLILYLSKDFYYEDIYENRGHSNDCRKIEDKLYCREYVPVNWYYEN